MAKDGPAKFLARRTPESAAMPANVKRAMAITARINRLTYDDAERVGARCTIPAGSTAAPIVIERSVGI